MLTRIILRIAGWPKSLGPSLLRYRCSERAFSHHVVQELDEESPPSSEWYRAAYGKLIRLTQVLNNVEQIDGMIMQASDRLPVTDERIIAQMRSFNSLTRVFIGSRPIRGACFDKPGERSSLTLNSLTKVCNLLNISAQQRKKVRITICQQVTQHHIWKGALEEVLNNLRREIDTLGLHSSSSQMGKQIVSSCIKFISDATTVSSSDSPSWMKPPPLKKVVKSSPSKTWEEVLEMFVDLTKSLETEDKLAVQVSKIEVLKEGLYQIRDIIIERDVSYKEVRRQDCLVQRKLSKSLGHSSKCLFTLLLYYLYGSVRDIEVDVRGRCVEVSEGRACVHIGKILTCSDEGMVMNGIKQLSRALGVFEFVWKTAGMSGVLELQGHLWCVGAEEKRIEYRGNVFFLHGIRL